jgi:predicted CoA-binding protein
MMNANSASWIDRSSRYAVVGASADPEKYGHRVFMDLLLSGYDVVPVNPKGGLLLGVPVVSALSGVEPRPDVTVFVTKPEVVCGLLPVALALGVTGFWFQPGSENEESRKWCADTAGVRCQFDQCIMVARRTFEEE